MKMIKRRIMALLVAGFAMVAAFQMYGSNSAQAQNKELLFYSTLGSKFEPVSNQSSVGVSQVGVNDPGSPCCDCACSSGGACTEVFTGRDCYVNGGCATDKCDTKIILAE
jgi:hypothetical protein